MHVGRLEEDVEWFDPLLFAVWAGALREADAEVAVEIRERLVAAG